MYFVSTIFEQVVKKKMKYIY